VLQHEPDQFSFLGVVKLNVTRGAPGCNVLRTYSQLMLDDVDLTHSARGRGLLNLVALRENAWGSGGVLSSTCRVLDFKTVVYTTNAKKYGSFCDFYARASRNKLRIKTVWRKV